MNPNRFPSIFKANSVPKFPFDEDFRGFDDIDEDENDCPNCKKPLSEHSPRERIRCALERIGGIPHYVDTKTT